MAIVAAGIIVALILLLVNLLPAYVGAFLGQLLYGIAKLLFQLCDFLQMIFRRLAGLDTYWIKDDASGIIEQEGDILLGLFSNQVVIEALISMTLFSVALLLIVTIVQIIRVEYTTEGSKNSKGTIIGKALKSLAMFVLIPVVCFLGIFVSNKLLGAVDAATAQSGASTLSGYIFLAGAADANVIRNGDPDPLVVNLLQVDDARAKAILDTSDGDLVGWDSSTYLRSNKASGDAMRADLASKIDQMFVGKYNWIEKDENTVITVAEARGIKDDNLASVDTTVEFAHLKNDFNLHYSKTLSVQYFYNLLDMNYLILYLGSGVILLSLLKASMGLVMRLYTATALFIVSPGVTALTPIDDGNAYKQWRKAFISNVLGAYGFIVAMNLLFLLLGIIDNIYLFNPNGNWAQQIVTAPANALVQAIMVIVGVNMLESLAKQISGFIGGADILSEGKGMGDKVTKTVGKIGTAVGGGVMMAKGFVGGLSERIYSNKATKALEGNTRGQKKMEELQKKRDSGEELTEKETKRLGRLEKKYENGGLNIAATYRARAAAGARARLRGGETLKSTWEGSAVGSFLNTATGGYVAGFGGKTLKNLDDKVLDGPEGEMIGKMAKKSDGGAILSGMQRIRGGIENKTGVTKLRKATKALTRKVGLDKTFLPTQGNFEENLAAHEVVDQQRRQYHEEMTHEVEENGKKKHVLKPREQKLYNEYVEKTSGPATIQALGAMQGNWNSLNETQLQKFVEGLRVGGLDEESAGIVNKLKSLGNGVGSREQIGYALDKIDVGSLKAGDISGYLDSDNGREGRIINGMINFEEDFKKRGFNATVDLATMMEEYEEMLAKRTRPGAAGLPGAGAPGAGGETGTAKDVNVNAQNVKMDTNNIDMKSNETKIDDNNKIASAMSKSLQEAFKQAQEKNKQETKESRTYEMLEQIKKILKNVEKNTKKK